MWLHDHSILSLHGVVNKYTCKKTYSHIFTFTYRHTQRQDIIKVFRGNKTGENCKNMYSSYFDYAQYSNQNGRVHNISLAAFPVSTSSRQEYYPDPVRLNLRIYSDMFSVQNLSLTMSLKSVM
jgi:hypothetical protein